MAKRKRLTPTPLAPMGIETKEAGTPRPAPAPKLGAAPVAQVAGDAAGSAALQEMADYIATARTEGRLAVPIPLRQIELAHLERDRLMPDDPGSDEDMTALVDSLRARGQQVPIDVVRLNNTPQERYGLISGLRRVTALMLLHAETGEKRFASVKARVIRPENMPDAYRTMVEENEIRAGLSFYERARIAVKSVEVGAFPDLRAALRGLYGNVSRAKRSKIGSFVPVVQALDGALRFPAALSEKRGLAIAQALKADAAAAARLREAVAGVDSAEAEQTALEAALKGPDVSHAKHSEPPAPAPTPAPEIEVTAEEGRLILSGPGVTEAFHKALLTWLAKAR